MLKNKIKTNKNYWKIIALIILLLISNIILLIGLIYYYSKVGINIEIETLDNLLTILATIIILGFISTRLPQLRKRGSSLYEIGYLIIITVIGVMDTYFNGAFGTPIILNPYLDMFKILSVILIFILLSTKMNSFKEMICGKYNRKNIAICLIIFTTLGIYASNFHINIDNTPANVRSMVIMISGLFGGPYVGIPAGIISGVYRYSLGGVTALPCAISTVISGVIGSLIFIWNDKKFPKISQSIILMFLFTGFEMLLIVIATPPNISFPFIHKIYPVMSFASVVGIILFSIVVKEEREKMNPPISTEEIRIKELENELEVHDEKIEELKNEIKELKKEKSS